MTVDETLISESLTPLDGLTVLVSVKLFDVPKNISTAADAVDLGLKVPARFAELVVTSEALPVVEVRLGATTVTKVSVMVEVDVNVSLEVENEAERAIDSFGDPVANVPAVRSKVLERVPPDDRDVAATEVS